MIGIHQEEEVCLVIEFARCAIRDISLVWGNHLFYVRWLTFKLPFNPSKCISWSVQVLIRTRAKTQCSFYSFALEKKQNVTENTAFLHAHWYLRWVITKALKEWEVPAICTRYIYPNTQVLTCNIRHCGTKLAFSLYFCCTWYNI